MKAIKVHPSITVYTDTEEWEVEVSEPQPLTIRKFRDEHLDD